MRVQVLDSRMLGRSEAGPKSLKELQQAVREFDTASHRHCELGADIRLAVTGNFSTQFLAQGFPMALARRGIRATLYESAYNQWELELNNPKSSLYAFGPTHIVIALTSIELAYASGRQAEAAAQRIISAVQRALEACDAHIFVTLPEPLSDEVSDQCVFYAWRSRAISLVRSELGSERVSLIDLEPLIRQAGASNWYADRYYDVAKLPYHPDRTPLLLWRLSDAVAGTASPPCKLIIVDLDDTLWGGRVGDEGWEGIDLDPAGRGRRFLRLQAFLKGLKEQGILLAIASKNNPEFVQQVFANRKEMLLQIEDFAATEIHWEPKSRSVANILRKLNLSTSGVVFLDDNAAERLEVGAHFPEIFIPELPRNASEVVTSLIETGAFDRRVVTSEARSRSQMYRENENRQQALDATGDIEAFLTNLDMVLEVSSPEASQARVVELIQKTNQFNLTARRYSWPEFVQSSSGGFAASYRLKDRFGDNGLISIISIRKTDDATVTIDLWLMSCRVFGRRVEHAILADIVTKARQRGFRRLMGEYRPTSKNAYVRNLYSDLGFKTVEQTDAAATYMLDLSTVPAVPDCIRVIDAG
jgi:FkbH-like protein